MKTMTNRAIYSTASRALENAGFEKVSSQFSKVRNKSGAVYFRKSDKQEIILNFKLAKEIVKVVSK